ncbi:class I SAM-dependent methyltransferase [cf. Phormidesmis sp. LEGE 11477]|uniref:class I SAM-dependent methyltransferase n=1 Tax=cf. Phormidesmis sp. LEGE 11477 TaxID=1828680 RepID=UPI0018807EA5|nr:class I SAM-dependent methyltransferase [cf. Phormidesmis sp. LEGE 11477]MBE9059904.1 class I SAM-dependent methyltransferase [cf. Phormidesmis sp. LEGE 11477]
MLDSTQRFSSRVENYISYRPRYPTQVLSTLQQDCGLTAASVIADVGSGTGFLSELFLANGNPVFAIEPNLEMRTAAEKSLGGQSGFVSVDGRAEATTLPNRSVDFVVAGQAFHWFDRSQARREFARILKPSGWMMLIWNDRETDSTPFLAAYEQLLNQYSPDYKQVNHKRIDKAVLSDFFSPSQIYEKSVSYSQTFDYEGLKGRMLSSSYVPEVGQRGHEEIVAQLKEIFREYSVGDRVQFKYVTRMFYGQISKQV